MQNKLFIFILFIFSLATYAEEFTVQKTWFGDPDLQGVWTNASLTTLERPDHFETLEISDEVEEQIEDTEDKLTLRELEKVKHSLKNKMLAVLNRQKKDKTNFCFEKLFPVA